MLKRVQAWVFVTVITLLIWVLAEAESVRVDSRSITVQIRPDPEGPRVLMVDPAETFNGAVSVRLEGSTASLDTIAEDLRSPIVVTPELLNLPAGTGKFVIDLKSALRAHPVFRDRGVTPIEASPETLTVSVDELVTRKVQVGVAVPDTVLLQGVAEADPNEVDVRLPARLALALPADAELIARPDPGAVSQLQKGRPQTLPGVRLELPQAIRTDPMAQFARPEPAAVDVTLTIQSGTETLRLASVPVGLRVSPFDLERLDIQMALEERDIADVEVTGPRDLMKQISEGKIQVFAVVPLDWQQLEAAAISGEPVTRQAVFMLSTESDAQVRFAAADRSVRLTVRLRAPAVSPTGPNGTP